jgi:tetratricopeptide (TPR) repeat protein
MSQLFLGLRDILQAEKHQHQAIEIAAKSENPIWLSVTYAGLAQVYAIQSQIEPAREAMATAEAISAGRNNIFLDYTKAQYASILNQQGLYTEADHIFHQGFYYLEKEENVDTIGVLANSYYLYSQSLNWRGNHQQAVQALKRAIEINKTSLAKIA